MFVHEGWWFVRDLKSKNGVKVNGKAQSKHLVPPASILSVGPHEFSVEYEPHSLGAHGITPPVDPF
jgi:adenylate cyclase